ALHLYRGAQAADRRVRRRTVALCGGVFFLEKINKNKAASKPQKTPLFPQSSKLGHRFAPAPPQRKPNKR
ncbi:hypothetical protein ABMZ06_15940, partial [Pseudomonas aeruginosa]|uniref:hypothetical protein n=1 Tax=Pseudomonas aeruginosa TaxID=287 RepID=UPI0039DFACA7